MRSFLMTTKGLTEDEAISLMSIDISLAALETRMKELRIQVILHKQKNLAWPVAETDSHWIIMGLDKDDDYGSSQRDQVRGDPGEDQRARRLRALQHRGELPRNPGGGHRARRARTDTEEHLRALA